MKEIFREFFGIGGYKREAQGAYSWQHLTFVTSLMAIMVALAIFIGRRNRNKDEKVKNKVLIWSAILIDGFEIIKIIMGCVATKDPLNWLINLPLFLCSIQLITIPLAAFSKGIVKKASLDFVFVFGILGAVLGTYGAAQNYASYPVLGWDNVVSGITHSISGFASLYIVISGMQSMEKKNSYIVFGIMICFAILAYVANVLIDYNYMFLMRGDGTPYDIFYNMVNGNKVLYPLIVVLLFAVYIFAFYGIYYLIANKAKSKKSKQ